MDHLLPRKAPSQKCLQYAHFTHSWSTTWTILFMIVSLTINCVAFSFVIALNDRAGKTPKARRQHTSSEDAGQSQQPPVERNGPYHLVNDPDASTSSTRPSAKSRHPPPLSWFPRALPLPSLNARRISLSTQQSSVPKFVQATLLEILGLTIFSIFCLALANIAFCSGKHQRHHQFRNGIAVATLCFLAFGVAQVVLGVIAGCHWIALLAKVCGWKVKTVGIFQSGFMILCAPILAVYLVGTNVVETCQSKYCLTGEVDMDEEGLQVRNSGELGENSDDLGAFIDEDAGEVVFDGDEEEEDDEDLPPSYDGAMAQSSSAAPQPRKVSGVKV